MWNTRKTQAILLCAAGVFMARMDFFLPIDKTPLFYLNVTGILLAFIGIAVYATAMPHVIKKVKICPSCFTKNEMKATACKKCKAPLQNSEASDDDKQINA